MNIGKVSINLIRGNTKTYKLSFYDQLPNGDETPIDLTLFDSITMKIKTDLEISTPTFLTFTVGSGLAISGEDNNVLEIAFSRQFISTPKIQFQYDILFIKNNVYDTLIQGVINILNVATI